MADFDVRINAAYLAAQDRFASIGVDTEAAMRRLQAARISLHCWQGDDVAGFEGSGVELGSGLAVTGNYLGRARTVDELRSDLDVALAMIPGRHRLNLHAIYGEFSGPVERDEINASHFKVGSSGLKPGKWGSTLIRPSSRTDGRRWLYVGCGRSRQA